MRHKPHYFAALFWLFAVAVTGQAKAAGELADLQTAQNALVIVEKNLVAAIKSVNEVKKAWDDGVKDQLAHAKLVHGKNTAAKVTIEKAGTAAESVFTALGTVTDKDQSLSLMLTKVREMQIDIKSSIAILKNLKNQSSSDLPSSTNRTRITIRLKLSP